MRARTVIGALLIVGVVVWVASDASRREWWARNSAPVGPSSWPDAAEWSEKVRHLTAESSKKELDQARVELSRSLEHASAVAGKDVVAARVALAKINAAERLKEARQRLAELKETGKKLSDTADAASQTLNDLQAKVGEAKIAYDSAKEEAAKRLP